MLKLLLSDIASAGSEFSKFYLNMHIRWISDRWAVLLRWQALKKDIEERLFNIDWCFGHFSHWTTKWC